MTPTRKSDPVHLKGCLLDESEVARTLAAFDPIWEVLHTPEKERILRLVVEKVTYDGTSEELTLAWRLPGISTLATEIGAEGGIRTQPPVAKG